MNRTILQSPAWEMRYLQLGEDAAIGEYPYWQDLQMGTLRTVQHIVLGLM